MRNALFNTLDVMADIDWHYFVLGNIAESKDMTAKEIRRHSFNHLRAIIKRKALLGYDTTPDQKAYDDLKAVKGGAAS